MAKTIQLEMTTPEKTALKAEAEFIVIPAVEGEMGILPGHEPYLAQLVPGEVRVTAGGEVSSFAVSGGFAEIRDNKVSLFAETAEMSEAISAELAHQQLEKARGEATRRDLDPMTLAAAEAAIRMAQVRLRVALRKSSGRSSPRSEQQ